MLKEPFSAAKSMASFMRPFHSIDMEELDDL